MLADLKLTLRRLRKSPPLCSHDTVDTGHRHRRGSRTHAFHGNAAVGIGPLDLVTFTAVPIILVAAAALASYLPARRTAAIGQVGGLLQLFAICREIRKYPGTFPS